MPEWYKERIKTLRPQFEAAALTHYGLKINSGPFGINSRPAMVGAKYANEQGKGQVYNRAMLRAYWQEARDISGLPVIKDIAESVGLNDEAYLAALQNPQYEWEVDADIQLAAHLGLDGVPALLIARKYLVMGAQPYEELCRMLDQLNSKGLIE